MGIGLRTSLRQMPPAATRAAQTANAQAARHFLAQGPAGGGPCHAVPARLCHGICCSRASSKRPHGAWTAAAQSREFTTARTRSMVLYSGESLRGRGSKEVVQGQLSSCDSTDESPRICLLPATCMHAGSALKLMGRLVGDCCALRPAAATHGQTGMLMGPLLLGV